MNLAEALNVVLPELPPTVSGERPPRMDPRVIAREHIEDKQRVLHVLNPGTGQYYIFQPEHWTLLQLFDGQRSWQEIHDAYLGQTGIKADDAYLKGFVQNLEGTHLWFQTPQERSAAMAEKLRNQRYKRLNKKSRWGDLSEITFPAWDPGPYLEWLHQRTRWVFTTGFFLASIALFAAMTAIFVARWDEVGRDTLQYFNFLQKGFWDIAEFWGIFLVIGFIHESAHGLACTHTGGKAWRMGFLLIYLSPAFYCDVTEAWVYGKKWQRIMVMAAGLWSETIVCALATIVWWASPAGGTLHDFCYKIMLIGGVAALAINLNPLVKADGYFIFTELIAIPDLREKATGYWMALMRRSIFRLKVDVPYVTPARRWFYVPYAILSGAYSYVLLTFLARVMYNVLRHYNPDWAFLPPLIFLSFVFRSRIRKALALMKQVYTAHRGTVLAWARQPRGIVAITAMIFFLFLPIWRETVGGRFILEPIQRAVIRAEVPGVVSDVGAAEGQAVAVGQPLLRLRNLQLTSDYAGASTDLQMASARATSAQLLYHGYGPAERQREMAAARTRSLEDKMSLMTLTAPISGVVMTPRLQDFLGRYLTEGTEAVEIADTRTLRARVYIPESDLRNVHVNSPAVLKTDTSVFAISARVSSVSPAPQPLTPGLEPPTQYAGIRPPQHYAIEILVPNADGKLRYGMTGDAKVFVRYRGIAGFVWEYVRDLFARKVW
jgi:putative peptide zinc metalloprotease protein